MDINKVLKKCQIIKKVRITLQIPRRIYENSLPLHKDDIIVYRGETYFVDSLAQDGFYVYIYCDFVSKMNNIYYVNPYADDNLDHVLSWKDTIKED